MLHFEGDKQYRHAPADVHAKLSDARFIAGCIPDQQAITKVELDVMVCVLQPGFSFARGTIEVNLRVVERVPPASVRYQVHGKGIGSSNDVEASVTLAPKDGGTSIHWIVDITALGGLLKMVPRGLIQAAAQKVIADLWAAVDKQLNP